VNSLQAPLCQQVVKQWETLRLQLPAEACIYTVSMDLPQAQASFQETAGVLHQMLSAHYSDRFGQDYGVWLQQWRQLARAVFVLDRHDRIAYAEYVADQQREPDYGAAMEAVQQAAWAWREISRRFRTTESDWTKWRTKRHCSLQDQLESAAGKEKDACITVWRSNDKQINAMGRRAGSGDQRR
jgi:peroxiredoxin